MSDSYQAVYDAVRSRISNGDIGAAVEAAIRGTCDASYVIPAIAQSFHVAADAMRAPHVLMRPTVSLDGDSWCALYGENLQVGVAGFGDTPEKACEAFDSAWKGEQR